ncbi:MAG: protein phosphatase 2C domain-containing protein [Oscillospiraceae bacterium]|nr:protein phosphatase 2C domain-containing protein [Oscillospiraceae bacterium]
MRNKKQRESLNHKRIITLNLAPRTGPIKVDAAEITVQPSFTAPVRIITAGNSVIGTRDYQQDALYVSDSVNAQLGEEIKAYGILCDGMGGMQSGEETSNLVVTEMRNELEALKSDRNIAEFMNEMMFKLDAMVVKAYGAGVAGTTVVTAVIFGNKLYWGAVGDSRIYLIRRSEIEQVTRDHNYYLYLKEDVEKRKITQQEADTHPMREALVSFVGSGNIELIDANAKPFELLDGDIVLLCSDGLTKSLTNDEIRRLVSTHKENLTMAAGSLTERAINIDMGPKDNTSVILIQYLEDKRRD